MIEKPCNTMSCTAFCVPCESYIHCIDDTRKVNGFKSRSSVFRILNKHGVRLNRGKFSGPLGKRKTKEERMKENEVVNE